MSRSTPISGRVLLDTNIVIALFRGETSVEDRLKETNEVFICSTVLGDLFFGAIQSSCASQNTKRITEFATTNQVLLVDQSAALEYGKIKAALSAKGRPIPENDIWVAAVAQQYGLVLLSRDDHFAEIDSLEREIC